MTAILNLTRTRGDTWPIKLTINNPDGTPMDLTGKLVVMTVNSEEDPDDTTTQIFQIVGTVTDATAGQVEFHPTATQADNVGLFYFDVEVSDHTPTYIWAASSGTADDPYIANDTDEYFIKRDAADAVTHQQRDGLDVMRLVTGSLNPTWGRYFQIASWPLVSGASNIRISGRIYFGTTGYVGLSINQARRSTSSYVIMGNETDYYGFQHQYFDFDPTTQVLGANNNQELYGHDTWTTPEWVEWIVEQHADGTYRGKIWQPSTESEPGVWEDFASDAFVPGEFDNYAVRLVLLPYAAGALFDVAWMKLEVI